jgi:hypothetical protein
MKMTDNELQEELEKLKQTLAHYGHVEQRNAFQAFHNYLLGAGQLEKLVIRVDAIDTRVKVLEEQPKAEPETETERLVAKMGLFKK